MFLTTFGLSPRESVLVRKAVPFFMKTMVRHSVFKNLAVCINKTDHPTDHPDLMGLVRCKLDKPVREFNITLYGKMSVKDFLFTVAHECVHVKQFATGERRDYLFPSFKINYGGQDYDPNNLDYWDMPWEKDALDKEEGLVVRFLAEYPEYVKSFGRVVKS